MHKGKKKKETKKQTPIKKLVVTRGEKGRGMGEIGD